MRILLAVTAILFSVVSCHTAKKGAQTMVEVRDTAVAVLPVSPSREDSVAADSLRRVGLALARIDSNRIGFETFSAKIKVDYKDTKDKNLDFNAFVRMRKDSVVWVSIIAALGVEAFRVLIRPDSVMIMDKLEKTIKYTTVSDLQRITQLPFDFTALQQLILGNPLYLEGELQSFREDGAAVTVFYSGDRFRHLASFLKPAIALSRSRLDDTDLLRKRSADLEYDSYVNVGGRHFSGLRRIRLAEQQTVDVKLEFRQVDFDTPLSYPFSVPSNYKLK
jgi:hypothetical protein